MRDSSTSLGMTRRLGDMKKVFSIRQGRTFYSVHRIPEEKTGHVGEVSLPEFAKQNREISGDRRSPGLLISNSSPVKFAPGARSFLRRSRPTCGRGTPCR